MDIRERERVLSRNFTEWFLALGALAKHAELFQILDVNEGNRVMRATLGGKRILITLDPGDNILRWMSEQGEVNLSELTQSGWSYLKGREIFEQRNFEALSSPKIKTDRGDIQITFGRHPDQGDTFVIRAGAAKLS